MLTDDQAINFGYVAVGLCDQAVVGASFDAMAVEDQRDGATPQETEVFYAYLRDEFCQSVTLSRQDLMAEAVKIIREDVPEMRQRGPNIKMAVQMDFQTVCAMLPMMTGNVRAADVRRVEAVLSEDDLLRPIEPAHAPIVVRAAVATSCPEYLDVVATYYDD